MKKIEEPVGEDITINEKSTFKETANFLRKKFNLSEDEIKELQLDGESFYLLERGDIKDLPVTEENKEKFRNYYEKFIWKKAETGQKELNNNENIKDNKDVNNVKIKSNDLDNNNALRYNTSGSIPLKNAGIGGNNDINEEKILNLKRNKAEQLIINENKNNN